MSQYIQWVVLNDGVSERVTPAGIDASEEAAVIDRCLIPVYSTGRGTVMRNSPYTVQGEVASRHALLRLFDENAPLADVGVALHSRSARMVWERICSQMPMDNMPAVPMPEAAPWCVVRCYAPQSVLPPWFEQWTKTAAVALMRREGW